MLNLGVLQDTTISQAYRLPSRPRDRQQNLPSIPWSFNHMCRSGVFSSQLNKSKCNGKKRKLFLNQTKGERTMKQTVSCCVLVVDRSVWLICCGTLVYFSFSCSFMRFVLPLLHPLTITASETSNHVNKNSSTKAQKWPLKRNKRKESTANKIQQLA